SIMLQTLFARHVAAQMGAHTGTPIAKGMQSSPSSMCTAYGYTHTGMCSMCSHLRGAQYARPGEAVQPLPPRSTVGSALPTDTAPWARTSCCSSCNWRSFGKALDPENFTDVQAI